MNIYLKNHLNSVYIIKFWYIRFCNRPPVFKHIVTITLHEQINTIRHINDPIVPWFIQFQFHLSVINDSKATNSFQCYVNQY